MAGALVQLAVLPSGVTTRDDSKIRGTWRRNGNASRIVITASLNSVWNSNRFFGSFPLRNQELKCHRGRTRSSRRKLCTVAMFERFSGAALKVIMRAQWEARQLGYSFVGTEHILLGLIGEGTGIGSKVLKSMGLNLKDARVEVEKIIGKGPGFVAFAENPFTPRAKRALELTLEEACQMGDQYIGSQHLLLGLLRLGEGPAARVLESLGADPNSIRTQVVRMVGEITEAVGASVGGGSSEYRGRTRSSRRKLCTVAMFSFERFTEKAIMVILLAQGEARRLGHSFVGTEQILLGLIGEGTGIAAKVLKSMGINLKDARVEVEKIIGKGSGFVAAENPFTARAKRVLELTLEEARQMGDNYIGSQHLLLGLLREGEGVAARVLEILGADPNSIRTQVVRMVGEITEAVGGSRSEIFNLVIMEHLSEDEIARLNEIFKMLDTDNSGDEGAPESEG